MSGASKKIVSKNISELVKSKPGKTRAKGIATLAKRRGITKRVAQQKQAIAIALNKAGKSKKS
jgi:hypothetical protein